MIITIIGFNPDKTFSVFPQFGYAVVGEYPGILRLALINSEFITVIPVKSIPGTYPHESLTVE
jgi:hypothetical protein